ncbi:interleukin 15 [Takifugu rubripes]|uniref:Interleukin n=1 Tax=Takifugu rubripes TaxID=31033 RepID=Q3SCC9_TAKRU|nr:interleukin 15 [Takifugu rubripes]AAZ20135.1 interleukin 15 [Takifugu rubripes]|eukprot:NP_001028220.1 interleukin 15 [Takifugu rubripes]
MRDFMMVQPTCLGEQRATGVHFQSSCHLCREILKAQVWFHLFVLCFLSPYTCAASVPETRGVQICVKALRPAIENSDAMLYAPSANSVKKQCKNMSLRCYMLELIMVINEEEIMDNNANCISDFNEILPTDNSVGCPPCEEYAIRNITIFLGRLQSLLEELNVIQNT